jgi:hypothetical protein
VRKTIGWTALALLALVAPRWASAAGNPVRLVIEDNAGLFSEGAKDSARQRLAQVNGKVDREVHLKTYPSLPEAMQARIDAAGKDSAKKNEVWREFTLSHVKGERGLVVLICWKPGRVEVATDRALAAAGFDGSKTRSLQQSLAKNLDAPSKNKNEAERRKELDQALNSFVNEVAQSIPLEKARVAAPAGGAPLAGKSAVQEVEQNNMLGWVCLGIVGLMVVWMVFGALRGSGAGAPGGFGGGPGYGGGGGGFLSNVLGGMFGAAAGMWMYNHFFGGGTPGASAGGWFGGGDSTGEEAGTGDFSGGTESGGDFGGGDSGGGWFGGGDSGGGDFGGGDFGGGDFGGD